MFSGKQIQGMSTGRKNVFIIRPENGAEWRNAALKPTVQRSSPLSWPVDLEISEFREMQLPELWLDMNTLLPCKASRSVWNYVKTLHTSSVCMSAILTFTSLCTCSCSYLCGWQSVRSKWRQGATKSWAHCGGTGVVNVNARRGPKITNPLNNSLRPRNKACANISGSACYLLVDALCLLPWNPGTSDFVQWKLSGR